MALKIDFYDKAFELFDKRVTSTPIRTPKPSWWRLGPRADYKKEIKRIKSRLMHALINSEPGSNQEFFMCCFNYLKRGAPEGLYEGLYNIIGEPKKAEPEDAIITE